MVNAWKTQWVEDNKKLIKRFQGDKPTAAVEFAKELKRRGILVVDVISVRKAYPPPLKNNVPEGSKIWCPYCVKWRDFHDAAVKKPDFTTPVLLRCTVCTISIRDSYVRKYNPLITAAYELTQERKKRMAKENKWKKRGKIDFDAHIVGLRQHQPQKQSAL